MLDAFLPESALELNAEVQLLNELMGILIRLEGFDPASERARAATWIFLHRPKVFVAGSPAVLPRYRFITSVPEGQYTDEAREAIVKEVTEAVARAEKGSFEEVSQRVWVFPTEVPDGIWGGRGRVLRSRLTTCRLLAYRYRLFGPSETVNGVVTCSAETGAIMRVTIVSWRSWEPGCHP